MTVLNRPDSLPSPPTTTGDPERSRSIVAGVIAVLAGVALAHLAVVAGLLLLAAAVTISVAPRPLPPQQSGGAD